MAESNFVDYVKIYCRSGKGGRGSTHMRREKYIPNGGPDGGDGGRDSPRQPQLLDPAAPALRPPHHGRPRRVGLQEPQFRQGRRG